MNKWMAAAMTAMVLAGTPAAHASTHSTSMEVSFRIQEACDIRSGASADGKDAQVSCQYRTPYQIVPREETSGAASSSASSTAARRTEQPLDTDAPAAVTVCF